LLAVHDEEALSIPNSSEVGNFPQSRFVPISRGSHEGEFQQSSHEDLANAGCARDTARVSDSQNRGRSDDQRSSPRSSSYRFASDVNTKLPLYLIGSGFGAIS
jgi:hypothetical protein